MKFPYWLIVAIGLAIIPLTVFLKRPKSERAVASSQSLIREDLKLGKGREATPGSKVAVHYTAWLTNGKQVASSKDLNDTLDFKVGNGEVIQGWDQGVVGMKVGGKRKLTVLPELGYGSKGAGDAIPPNATLIFEVELVDVT